MPRSTYERSEYSPSPPRRRDRGGNRVIEHEDVEITERRRGGPMPDFLREDRGRSRNGQLVVRDEEIIEERSKGRPRPRDFDRLHERDRGREIVDEEVVIARSGNRERPRRRDVVEEEEEQLRVRRDRERPRRREIIEEEEVRIRDSDRPRREVIEDEEVRIRDSQRPRRREVVEEEEIRIREDDRRRHRRDFEEEEDIYRRDRRRRPGQPREFAEEDFRIRERQDRDFGGRSEIDEEEVRIHERDRHGRRRPIEHEEIREDLVYEPRPRRERRGDDINEEWIYSRPRREPPMIARQTEEWTFAPASGREADSRRGGDVREESIAIRERERDGGRYDGRREDIDIRERERDRYGQHGDVHEDTISIRETSRERPRGRGHHDEEIRIRHTSQSTSRERTRPLRRSSNETITIRNDHAAGRDGSRSREEIVIRHRSPSAGADALGGRGVDPIRAPPIHQDIITHHRHIDHGYEYARQSGHRDDIEIRRREDRNGDRREDIIINHRDGSPNESGGLRPGGHGRRRSASVESRTVGGVGGGAMGGRDEAIDEEAEYYARRVNERAYPGEAYHGATRDWAIVDVPPGTNRVRMDGIGGGSQEITWQRYNGVRRSRFDPDGAGVAAGGGELAVGSGSGRRFAGSSSSRKDRMWTEITKDLVIKEALEGSGYDFEETEFFFYVMEYLRYEDVERLVRISDDLRARRRARIRQIEWEAKRPDLIYNGGERGVGGRDESLRPGPAPLLADRAWDEERERIVEREWYDKRPPSRLVERERERDRERERIPAALPAPLPPSPGQGLGLGSGSRAKVGEKDRVVIIRTTQA